MLDLFSKELCRDPYPLYAALREASPVFEEPRTGLWLILDHAGVKQALEDPAAFSSRAAPPESTPGRWFIFADPPRHARLRGLVSKAFTPRSIAALEPRIRQIARELIGARLADGELDVAVDLAIPLPLLVIGELLGAPTSDLQRLRRWSDSMVGLVHTLSGGEAGARAEVAYGAASAEMQSFLAALIEERRALPKDDLLSRLLAADLDGERLSGDEIFAFFQLLLLAGHETTTNLIGNAVLSLAEHPAELDRLRARPELLPATIEEVLRYRAPVQMAFRRTTREVPLHGKTIPANKLVLLAIGSANRDPAQFKEPDRFDPGRDQGPHLAFGRGIHFCIGAALARLEARIAIGELLARTTQLELIPERPWEPRQSLHVHGPTSLPVRFQPAPARAAGL